MAQQISLRFGTLYSYLKGQDTIRFLTYPELEKLGGKAVVFTCPSTKAPFGLSKPGDNPCHGSPEMTIMGGQKTVGSTQVEEIIVCLQNDHSGSQSLEREQKFTAALMSHNAPDFQLDSIGAWT